MIGLLSAGLYDLVDVYVISATAQVFRHLYGFITDNHVPQCLYLLAVSAATSCKCFVVLLYCYGFS